MKNNPFPSSSNHARPGRQRRMLHAEQIEMIEEALAAIGEFGEVRLVVEKGRLRFLHTEKSYDVLKWSPGLISSDMS